MPTLTVKDVIKSELLKVCKEVTSKLREKDNKKDKKRKFSDTKVDEFHKMVAHFWTGENQGKFSKIFAHLLDAPELNTNVMIPTSLFCVVVFGTSNGGHGYSVGKPCIVTHDTNKLCLFTDGIINNWTLQVQDKPRLATDEEIEACIEALTPQQWGTIHSHALFKPIMDAAMNRAVTVEEPADNGELEDDAEIRLKDGRTITLAGAPDKD